MKFLMMYYFLCMDRNFLIVNTLIFSLNKLNYFPTYLCAHYFFQIYVIYTADDVERGIS